MRKLLTTLALAAALLAAPVDAADAGAPPAGACWKSAHLGQTWHTSWPDAWRTVSVTHHGASGLLHKVTWRHYRWHSVLNFWYTAHWDTQWCY